MIQFLNSKKENLIALEVSGKVSKEDVEKIHPLIHDITIKNKKVDFYLELQDFHGYEIGGFWADIKIDSAHISDYGRMAIVGEKKWQELVTQASDLFTGSEVKYFDFKDIELAKAWIRL